MCVSCFASKRKCHFSWEKGDLPKLVISSQKVTTSNGIPWKSSRILRPKPNFFIFLHFSINCFFFHFFIFQIFPFFMFVMFFSLFYSVQFWRLLEELPLLRCLLCRAVRTWKSGHRSFALVSFSRCSGVWVLPVEYVVLFFRDACAAWFNSGYMFYGRLWTNFSIFYVAVNSNPGAFGLHSF